MTGHRDRAVARVDDAANDADERRLARAVGTQKREDLAPLDLEIDGFQSLKTGGVGLGKIGDGNHGRHGTKHVMFQVNPRIGGVGAAILHNAGGRALLLNSWALTKILARPKQPGLLAFGTPLFKGHFLPWLVEVTPESHAGSQPQ